MTYSNQIGQLSSLLLLFRTSCAVFEALVINCKIFGELFPSVSNYSDHFTLIYFNLSPDPNCPPYNSHPQVAPSSVVLTSSFTQAMPQHESLSPYNSDLLLPYITQLSTKDLTVVLISCHPSFGSTVPQQASYLMSSFETFKIPMLSYTTMLLIFGEKKLPENLNWNLAPWVYNMPASKLYIVYDFQDNYRLYLIRFNASKMPTLDHFPSEPLDDPAAFHKRYFSVYKTRYSPTPAVVSDSFNYIREFYHAWDSCLHLVHQPSKYCAYEIMTVNYLAQLHNMSFILRELSPQSMVAGVEFEYISGM